MIVLIMIRIIKIIGITKKEKSDDHDPKLYKLIFFLKLFFFIVESTQFITATVFGL